MRNLPGDTRFLSPPRWISTGAGISVNVLATELQSYSCSLSQGVQAFLWTPGSRQEDSLGTLQKSIYCSLQLVELKHLAPCASLKLSPLLLRTSCKSCAASAVCAWLSWGHQEVSGHHILHVQRLLGGDTSPCAHAGASVSLCAGVSGSWAHLTHATEQIQQAHLTGLPSSGSVSLSLRELPRAN